MSGYYWGVCDGCPSGLPQSVQDVDGATVCDYHALQDWHDPGEEPRHVEDWGARVSAFEAAHGLTGTPACERE